MYAKYVELRDKMGVRDADVAKTAGIAPSVFSNWKSGKCNPNTDKLLKIAKFFGVTLEELVKGE